MSQLQFSVKCEFCKNRTKDSSGRCHEHRNLSGESVRKIAFGTGLTPKISGSNPDSDTLYLEAANVKFNIQNGITYELDMSDGYGEIYDEISSITDAGKPNEGMLAFNTKLGATIYFLPNEFVDVISKQNIAA